MTFGDFADITENECRRYSVSKAKIWPPQRDYLETVRPENGPEKCVESWITALFGICRHSRCSLFI